MKEIVFLLEERSMMEVLKVIVPRLVPPHISCRFIPHEGKQDLEKSIPRKLRAWRTPGARFVIVRDLDSADCRVIKRRLVGLCAQGNRPDSLVRIVCDHLESWFLGDFAALEKAYGVRGVARRRSNRVFQHPDRLANAEQELRRIVPTYQKIGGSRMIAPHLDLDCNNSHSFRVFLDGIRRLVAGESKPVE